jgi:hypothetical protein
MFLSLLEIFLLLAGKYLKILHAEVNYHGYSASSMEQKGSLELWAASVVPHDIDPAFTCDLDHNNL